MAGMRQVRVERVIMELLASMILRGEVKDPRVNSLISISDVAVSRDLAYADVRISGYMDEQKLERAAAGLNSAAGFIQSSLAREMRTRNTPKLRFSVNPGIREGFEMSKKLGSLVEPDEAPTGTDHSE